jgi:hypothetical protein
VRRRERAKCLFEVAERHVRIADCENPHPTRCFLTTSVARA